MMTVLLESVNLLMHELYDQLLVDHIHPDIMEKTT